MTAPAAVTIAARRLAAEPNTLGPRGKGWEGAAETRLDLAPTPLDGQSSAYVRSAWASREYGMLGALHVAAVVSGGGLHIRLRWAAPTPQAGITDNDVFADACAVMFPANGTDAEMMGSEAKPVHLWHWRAGTHEAFVLAATGPGTSKRAANHPVSVQDEWLRDEWAVVFSQPLQTGDLPLHPGATTPVAFAVWQGCNNERAGLASHTPEWHMLEISD